MTDLTVPAAPPLGRVPNVEIGAVGNWLTSSGPMTLTVEDLYSCVAALDCPAVRRPTLKPGHTGTFGIGDPTIGYIANLAVADSGQTLVGDYCGMPGWLVDQDANGDSILAATYADRSGEWVFDYTCALGHTHPCVLAAVSLLGVEFPAIGTIASLQDVASFYGVAADALTGGMHVVITTRQETSMPNPQPRQVAASVTSDDVRRAFYASPAGSSWDIWIEEIQLDPLQIVYANDADGFNYRIPVTIGAGDGTDAVTFGEPVRVVNNWTDAPVNQAAASVDAKVLRFANRQESRPGGKPAAAPPSNPPVPGGPNTEGAGMDPAKLREALGLNADASDIEVQTALATSGVIPKASEPAATTETDTTSTETENPTTQVPDGMSLVDTETLEGLKVAASAGQEARAEQLKARREQLVNAAVNDGRIPPARKDAWVKQLEADSGAEQVLASLAPGLVPVEAKGHSGGADDAPDAFTDEEAEALAKLTRLPKEAFSG